MERNEMIMKKYVRIAQDMFIKRMKIERKKARKRRVTIGKRIESSELGE